VVVHHLTKVVVHLMMVVTPQAAALKRAVVTLPAEVIPQVVIPQVVAATATTMMEVARTKALR
jgi:hypothetical protein